MTQMMEEDQTVYSEIVDGDKANYDWRVRFDLTGGKYLGITQYEGDAVKDRILLSPNQVSELLAFLRPYLP
jgi:hypothetical protein